MEDARAGHWPFMRRVLALAATGIALLLCGAGCAPPRAHNPVIGAKNFTEQVLLGELLAQHIEARTGFSAVRISR